MNTQILEIILVALAIIGICISFLIFIKTPKFCRKGEACDVVIGSKYGRILGVDLSIYGIIYYLINICLTLSLSLNLFTNNKEMVLIKLTVSVILGFLFSLYLLFMQIFVIKNICKKCLVSFFVNLLSLIILNFLF